MGKLEEAVKKAKANKLWRVRSSGGRRCEAAADSLAAPDNCLSGATVLLFFSIAGKAIP